MAKSSAPAQAWWKECTVYQIYPSTFADSNGDGWGDLKGITSKLDYLKDLGVDVIWVSPIYKSPQADMGYDIADYEDIDPRYGSLADVDELITGLKQRDMRLMMDLVVNHTSNEHAWFLESAKAKDSPKRDWYIWKPPKGYEADGTPIPPNNWMQLLGDAHSAWTFDKATGEFFLAMFTPEQPDLNWENPAVRTAVHDVMRFWLDRGVSGFRMDVINLISKDQRFPDAPINMPPGHKYHDGHEYFANGPRMHEWLRDMHREVLAKYDTITVGEMPFVDDTDEIMQTVGAKAGELNMIFIFDIVGIDEPPGRRRTGFQAWDASDVSRIQTKWQRVMIDRDGWNSVFISNHDQPRPVSRYTDDSDENGSRSKGAKLLALMESTLSGTLFVYQGEELGMRNVPESWDPEVEYKDIDSVNWWNKSKVLHKDDPAALKEARKLLRAKARDNSRTPMQWSAGPNAGFAPEGATPWMRVNEDFPTLNAAAQMQEDQTNEQGGVSIRSFWQRCIKSRKLHKDMFIYGDYELVSAKDDPKVYAYARISHEGARGLVVLNFSGEATVWKIPKGNEVEMWVLNNYGAGPAKKATEGDITLEPWECLLGKCKQGA